MLHLPEILSYNRFQGASQRQREDTKSLIHIFVSEWLSYSLTQRQKQLSAGVTFLDLEKTFLVGASVRWMTRPFFSWCKYRIRSTPPSAEKEKKNSKLLLFHLQSFYKSITSRKLQPSNLNPRLRGEDVLIHSRSSRNSPFPQILRLPKRIRPIFARWTTPFVSSLWISRGIPLLHWMNRLS